MLYQLFNALKNHYVVSFFADAVQYKIYEFLDFGAKITNAELYEGNVDIDWPFAFNALENLEIPNFKRSISDSIYNSLSEIEKQKYIPVIDGEPTLEKALIGIFELYFIQGPLIFLPDLFYKSLFFFYYFLNFIS